MLRWGDLTVKLDLPVLYLQNTLYAKVVLALLSGRGADGVLDTQRSAHLRAMRELIRRKTDGDLVDQLICDHALFHLEADLRWLELVGGVAVVQPSTRATLGTARRMRQVLDRRRPQRPSLGSVVPSPPLRHREPSRQAHKCAVRGVRAEGSRCQAGGLGGVHAVVVVIADELAAFTDIPDDSRHGPVDRTPGHCACAAGESAD